MTALAGIALLLVAGGCVVALIASRSGDAEDLGRVLSRGRR